MATMFSLPEPSVNRKNSGQLVGSAWLRKGGHISVSLTGLIPDKNGKKQPVKETYLVFKTEKDEYRLQLGSYQPDGSWDPSRAGLFLQKKLRKREGVERDSDYFVRAYPKK